MVSRRRFICAVDTSPPPEIRLIKPGELIPTPLDSRGLVNANQLILDVNSTVDPNYTWPSAFNDNHHLQWPRSNYVRGYQTEFRNLPISRIMLPRNFHNWLHRVTEPPSVPSTEICRYRIEENRVVGALFRAASIAVHLDRMRLSDATRERKRRYYLEKYQEMLEQYRHLPVEFLQVKPDEYELVEPSEFARVAPVLGRHATSQSVAPVTRIIRQRAA